MKKDKFGQARILSPEELDQLIAAIPYSHHKVLAILLRYSGCRCTEAAKSKWKNYSSDFLLLPKPDTKTDTSRSIPINNKLKLELDLWKEHSKPLNDDEYIFKGRFANSHLRRQSFDKAIRKYSPFKDVSTHTFRRSVLTAMKRAGVPLDVIRSISGHADIKTLELYLGIDSVEQFAAVNVL